MADTDSLDSQLDLDEIEANYTRYREAWENDKTLRGGLLFRDTLPALISYARSLESQLAESQRENAELRQFRDITLAEAR